MHLFISTLILLLALYLFIIIICNFVNCIGLFQKLEAPPPHRHVLSFKKKMEIPREAQILTFEKWEF